MTYTVQERSISLIIDKNCRDHQAFCHHLAAMVVSPTIRLVDFNMEWSMGKTSVDLELEGPQEDVFALTRTLLRPAHERQGAVREFSITRFADEELYTGKVRFEYHDVPGILIWDKDAAKTFGMAELD